VFPCQTKFASGNRAALAEPAARALASIALTRRPSATSNNLLPTTVKALSAREWLRGAGVVGAGDVAAGASRGVGGAVAAASRAPQPGHDLIPVASCAGSR